MKQIELKIFSCNKDIQTRNFPETKISNWKITAAYNSRWTCIIPFTSPDGHGHGFVIKIKLINNSRWTHHN